MLFLKSKKAVGTRGESKFLVAPACWGTGYGAGYCFLGVTESSVFIMLLCLCTFWASCVAVNQICCLSGVILMLKLVRKEQIHWQQFWAPQMSCGREPGCLLAPKTKWWLTWTALVQQEMLDMWHSMAVSKPMSPSAWKCTYSHGPQIFPGEGGFSVAFVSLLPSPCYLELQHGRAERLHAWVSCEVWVLSLERGNGTVLVAGCAHLEPVGTKTGIKSQPVGEQLAAADSSPRWLLGWTDVFVRGRDWGALTCLIREAALSCQNSSCMSSCFM